MVIVKKAKVKIMGFFIVVGEWVRSSLRSSTSYFSELDFRLKHFLNISAGREGGSSYVYYTFIL